MPGGGSRYYGFGAAGLRVASAVQSGGRRSPPYWWQPWCGRRAVWPRRTLRPAVGRLSRSADIWPRAGRAEPAQDGARRPSAPPCRSLRRTPRYRSTPPVSRSTLLLPATAGDGSGKILLSRLPCAADPGTAGAVSGFLSARPGRSKLRPSREGRVDGPANIFPGQSGTGGAGVARPVRGGPVPGWGDPVPGRGASVPGRVRGRTRAGRVGTGMGTSAYPERADLYRVGY